MSQEEHTYSKLFNWDDPELQQLTESRDNLRGLLKLKRGSNHDSI